MEGQKWLNSYGKGVDEPAGFIWFKEEEEVPLVKVANKYITAVHNLS